MRKITLILITSLIALSIAAQHSPTPTNPWKWYTINKDTTFLNQYRVKSFEVTVWMYEINNQCAEVDSLGNLLNDIHKTSISFFIYVDRDSRDCRSNYFIEKFTIHFDGLPFVADPSVPGGFKIINNVNNALAKHFNVTTDKIIE